MEQRESPESNSIAAYDALLVAFKTMKERCFQLQTRLFAVEEENIYLRQECGKNMSSTVVKLSDEKTTVEALQAKVEVLSKQKSQLTDHIFMVAAENRQLWNRLTKFKRTNKSLGNQLTKISDTLKQHSPLQSADIESYSFFGASSSNPEDASEGKQSLEEISLRLINSFKLKKSELEQQYAEMVELQNNTGLNSQHIGFTYPEDSDTDSFEQLKQHDIRMSQTKDALLAQQTRLKRALQNLRNMKKGEICSNCRMKANKKTCQAGTQFDSDDSFREHGSTQTSLPAASISLEKCSYSNDKAEQDRICPLCGTYYKKSTLFTEFHEHVISHFNKDPNGGDGFEIVH